MSAEAQSEKYVYHSGRECLRASLVSSIPPNTMGSGSIAYSVIGAIWPQIKEDTIGRFSVIRKEGNTRSMRTRNEPQNSTSNVSKYYRNLHREENNDGGSHQPNSLLLLQPSYQKTNLPQA